MYIAAENKILVCKASKDNAPVYMYPKMANRHGLIAGATGTGKTVTLKVLAEAFSDMGVPVFLADIKGDVSGMCMPGVMSDGFAKRLTKIAVTDLQLKGYPVRFFDVFGKKGQPVRTTVSEMGPDLLSRLLDLNETQSGVMHIIFKIADDNGLLLLDLKDLRSMAQFVADNAAQFKTTYGNVSAQSVGAIQRCLLQLEGQGGDIFFGEPALDIKDWLVTDSDGRGVINLLHCVELFQNPLLYSTFLLWMLSELYDTLPEAGDLDKPKMVFFFDEAHLIFNDAPESLIDKVEQIVRLIRSMGVGIYFVTQLPSDIPDNVLGQLGNKFQHALRAYTPKDIKGLKAAAQSFRANPELDTETALQELGTGEVLVSVLGEDGVPTIAQRAFVMPPASFLGVCDDNLRNLYIAQSPLYAKYAQTVDRESAYELLMAKAKIEAEQEQKEEEEKQRAKEEKERIKQEREAEREAARQARLANKKEPPTIFDKMLNKTVNRVQNRLCDTLVRSIFGCLKK